MEWEVGFSRCKLLQRGWANNKVLLHNTENYLQCPMVNHNGKGYFKMCVCVCVCVYARGTAVVKNPPAAQETRVRPLGQEDPLEKEMATHSGILA